jgi:Na+-driven multidrug efflux pump
MLILDLISMLGIMLPLALLGGFVWGWSPVAVTFILNSDQVFKCIPAYIHVNSYRWVKRLTRQ